MKILLATDVYFPTIGGMSVACGQLATALAHNGYSVTIIAPAHSLKPEQTSTGGITTYRLPSLPLMKKKGIRLVLHPLAVKQLIKTIKPDVVHVMNLGPQTIGQAAFTYAKKFDIPVVLSVHFVTKNFTAPLHLSKQVEEQLEGVILKKFHRLARTADAIVFPSTAAADKFPVTGVLPVSVVISNGLYLEPFQTVKPAEITGLRKKLNLPDKKIILYTGRLDHDKRIHILIKALPGILKTSDAHLLIIGKGIETERLQALAIRLGVEKSVTFGGFIADASIPVVYRLASVFAMPSDVELQSIATMEAMAAGLPVVAANAIALPLLVKDRENGFLFTPNDSDDLAQKLTTILSNPTLAAGMGKASAQFIKKHAMQEVILRFEALYKQVTTGK
jgi:glycosyltransferase involved in cell wall biosynthesis